MKGCFLLSLMCLIAGAQSSKLKLWSSIWLITFKKKEMKNNKIVKVLNQQICLAGCSDSSAWPYCSVVMDHYGGCYSQDYGDDMKNYCQGSCPQFCRKLLPPVDSNSFRASNSNFFWIIYFLYLQKILVNGVHGLKDLVIGHVEEVREKTLEPN